MIRNIGVILASIVVGAAIGFGFVYWAVGQDITVPATNVKPSCIPAWGGGVFP